MVVRFRGIHHWISYNQSCLAVASNVNMSIFQFALKKGESHLPPFKELQDFLQFFLRCSQK